MASPITWRNVNGPSLAEFSRPMEAAQRSFNSGFDVLGGMLKQNEAIDDKNWLIGKDNNTQAFLDRLSQVKTPEEAAALDAELQAQRQGFGAQIDRTAARAGQDMLESTLRKRVTEGQQYGQAQLVQQNLPRINAARIAALNGDPSLLNALLTELPQLANAPELTKEAVTAERDLIAHQQGNVKLGEQLRLNESTISTQAAQARAATTNAETNQLEAQLRQQAAAASLRTAALAAQDDTLKKTNIVAAGDGLYTEASAQRLRKALVDSKKEFDTPEDLDQILKYANKNKTVTIDIPDPNNPGKMIKKTLGVPYAVVEAAAQQSTDGLFRIGWNTGFAKDMEERIKASMKETIEVPKRDASGNVVIGTDGRPVMEVRNRVLYDQAAYENYFANRLSNPGAPGSKKK